MQRIPVAEEPIVPAAGFHRLGAAIDYCHALSGSTMEHQEAQVRDLTFLSQACQEGLPINLRGQSPSTVFIVQGTEGARSAAVCLDTYLAVGLPRCPACLPACPTGWPDAWHSVT